MNPSANISKAQEARRQKSLNIQKNYSGYGILRAREFVQRALADGYRLLQKEVEDTTELNKLEREYDFLRREAPIGNCCHPQTIRLTAVRDAIAANPKKTEYRMVSPSGSFFVVNKTVYEYALDVDENTPRIHGAQRVVHAYPP